MINKIKKPVIRKPAIKFIDKLYNFLVQSGSNIHRDGWHDYKFDASGKRSEKADDKCEWVDIKLEEVNGQRYIVQFYFTDNCTKLLDVKVFIQKRKKGWKSEELLASSKEKNDKNNIPEEKPQSIANQHYGYA